MMARGEKHVIAKRVAAALLVVVIVLLAGFAWYVSDYYHADDEALAAVADGDGAADGVTVSHLNDGSIAFVPENPQAGLVFYPGAKVQPEAYAPLLTQCARRGVLCVLVKPPFNLAIFNVDAASGASRQFPDVKKWTIAGHSLGGVVSTMYVSQHPDEFSGIALLASYADADVSSLPIRVVSIVGTNDGVLDRARYESAKSKLPDGARELEIPGGNHAYFGNYGEQAGDGTAEISRQEQQGQAVDAMAQTALSA